MKNSSQKFTPWVLTTIKNHKGITCSFWNATAPPANFANFLDFFDVFCEKTPKNRPFLGLFGRFWLFSTIFDQKNCFFDTHFQCFIQ